MRVGRADVEEVHPVAVDLGDLLGQRVELGLVGPPVEVQPVPGERADPVEGDAVVGGRRVRPAGAAEAVGQVVEFGLRDGDPNRSCG
ncbi:hypothetical protein Q0Z83_055940 [Actinoplanes sichuanensis]|nr:hypothetical protein Q0Z83_055940 [Actinoplanes sichuanensis]